MDTYKLTTVFTKALLNTSIQSMLSIERELNTKKVLTKKELDDLFILDLRVIVFGGLLLPMATIGIILNAFTILVLLHPRMRNSTNIYLTALSIANILSLVNFIFLYSLRYILSYSTFKESFYTAKSQINAFENFISLVYQYWNPAFTTVQLFGIYLTCAVTIDRWIYLAFPLKADSICTIKVTLKIIGSIFGFCFLYVFPRWFELESVRIQNTSYYKVNHTSFGSNPLYIQIYGKYSYFIFVYGLPFLVLLVVNIGIIIKLIETKNRKRNLLGGGGNRPAANKVTKENQRKSSIPLLSSSHTNITSNNTTTNNNNVNNNNNSTTNNNNNNNNHHANNNNNHSKHAARRSVATLGLDPKITLMVLAVVMAFFCSQFPLLILHLLAQKSQGEKWFKITKTFCDFLAALNCCINFLIYCCFGRNFRDIAKQILYNPSLNPYSQIPMRRNAHIGKVGKKAKQLKKTNNTPLVLASSKDQSKINSPNSNNNNNNNSALNKQNNNSNSHIINTKVNDCNTNSNTKKSTNL